MRTYHFNQQVFAELVDEGDENVHKKQQRNQNGRHGGQVDCER